MEWRLFSRKITTHHHKNEWDPDGNHIGIATTSIFKPVTAVSLNGSSIDAGNQLKSILNQSIDISDFVSRSVYVGFTASTGKVSAESHQVLDWTFTSEPLHHLGSKGSSIKTPLVIIIPVIMGLIIISSPLILYIKKLSKATQGFSKGNLVGSGGFASVYKGMVSESDLPSTIAVKKISATSKQGIVRVLLPALTQF